MKANAPEKIYLYPSDRTGEEYEDEWGTKPWGEDYVEYTRTDDFEVNEVDLEKEKDDYWNKLCDSEFGELFERDAKWFDDIAKHFFELGLKTRKGG